MSVTEYIAQEPADRQDTLTAIHQIITSADKSVEATIEPMMGKEMIIYKCNGVFRYALGDSKKHISLHLMPIYMLPALHAKYKSLLPLASFQKGCVNFTNISEMPLAIVKNLMDDCAAVDLVAIREEQLRARKK